MALEGLKFIEIAGSVPASFCGHMLVDYEANIMGIERLGHPPLGSVKRRGRLFPIDIFAADVFIEPIRPDIMQYLSPERKSRTI